MEILASLLSPAGFMPHGHCFLWTPGLLWSYVISDSLIWLSYYSIPIALWYFVRRRVDLPFNWVFVMFAVFIFACGTTHLIAIWNIWQPVYWLDAGIKLATAAASVGTAIVLWPLVPKVLGLPSPRKLEESNRLLQREIVERNVMERRLQEVNRLLEQHVKDRDAEIDTATARLRDQIAERNESAQALQKSQQLLRALADSLSAIIWIKDLDGRYLLVNRSYAELVALPKEAIIGKTDYDLFDAEQAERFRKVDQQAIGAGAAVQVEDTLTLEANAFTYLSIKSPLADESGHTYAVCGVSTDISERKRSEQALAAERALLRTLIDALPDLVFTKDPEGRFRLCNAAELKHLGLAHEDELIGKTVFDLYSRELAERYHTDDMEALHGAPVLNREEPCVDRDGKPRWHLTIKVPLRDHDNKIRGLVGISRDITERKRAQEYHQRAQKLEALGTLAGGVAHDFNNLLLAIAGNVQLATADLPVEHPVQQSLEEIQKAASRATDLVRRILAFTRGQQPQRMPIQLEPVVEEALTLLRATLPAMIRIETSFAQQLPPVTADSTEIHQVVVNLLTNAAHAIGERSGLIEVGLDTETVTAEAASMMPDLRPGRYVRLCVSDSGSGMDKETVSRIFDPYFTTKPHGQGSGLGLSIVHGVVRSHDGAISVYSVPDSGTRFVLYFPARHSEVVETGATAPAPIPGKGQRVLYIDDEHSLVLLVTRTLTRLDYAVTGITDPFEALKVFRSRPNDFDVVVTDLAMPGMSGFDLVREMLLIRSDIPVVMTSGYLRPEDQRTAAELGLRALILKPNTSAELGAVLNRIFTAFES
jgi:PAS domain S-box-containing protein